MYRYWCRKCRIGADGFAEVYRRHIDAPRCVRCNKKTKLLIQPVSGLVKNPAVAKGK